MSTVANIILCTELDDGGNEDMHPNVDLLNNWIIENHYCKLSKVDQFSGGNKVLGSDIFIGAINYLRTPQFIEYFRTIDWESPGSVQLMIKEEDDDAFTIYNAIKLGE